LGRGDPHDQGCAFLGAKKAPPKRGLRCVMQRRVRPSLLHEIKHDGFRVIARKDGARVRLENT
jgi:hypothetical protein